MSHATTLAHIIVMIPVCCMINIIILARDSAQCTAYSFLSARVLMLFAEASREIINHAALQCNSRLDSPAWLI